MATDLLDPNPAIAAAMVALQRQLREAFRPGQIGEVVFKSLPVSDGRPKSRFHVAFMPGFDLTKTEWKD